MPSLPINNNLSPHSHVHLYRTFTSRNTSRHCSNQHQHHRRYHACLHKQNNDAPPTDSPPANSSTNQTISTSTVDDRLLSPMMLHYVETKRRLFNSLCSQSDRKLMLLYRCGDFFESFFEDAYLLSHHCGLALTSKDGGKSLNTRIPMAGLPHFCLDDKLSILLSNNITIAVVDQLPNQSSTNDKKLMKRVVTKLLSPATASQDASKMSYIVAICINNDNEFSFGLSYTDVCTGEFKVTQDQSISNLKNLLSTLYPVEIIISPFISDSKTIMLKNIKSCEDLTHEIRQSNTSIVTLLTNNNNLTKSSNHIIGEAERIICEFNKVDSVESLGCKDLWQGIYSCSLIINYLFNTLNIPSNIISLNKLTTFSQSEYLQLDESALNNLEIIESLRDSCKNRSLQWAIDKTITTMGSRRLKKWIMRPRRNYEIINTRHDAVEQFINDVCMRDCIRNILKNMPDLERIAGKIYSNRISPRELLWLCECLFTLPNLINLLPSSIINTNVSLDDDYELNVINGNKWNDLIKNSEFIIDSLANPSPSTLPSPDSISDAGQRVFRHGYNPQLDSLRETACSTSYSSSSDSTTKQSSWVNDIEIRERNRSGVESLRVKHIRNSGYVVRIPRSQGEKLLSVNALHFSNLGYEHVQGTKLEIRFTFKELRKLAKEHALTVSEIINLERKLYFEILNYINPYILVIRQIGSLISCIDVITSFACISSEWQYTRPSIINTDEMVIDIKNSRHAIVEQMLPVNKTYVPNNIKLSTTENETRLLLLCGMNSAGKSCALRSIGIIIILSHSGCFIPCTSAKLSIFDKLFTRVGAIDDVSKGQSTFQIEMAETCNILSHITNKSLVLLDEIGRGTSTSDGIALAWSIAEELIRDDKEGRPLTMFVTHFHDLNHLATIHHNINAFHMGIKKCEGELWLSTHIIESGPCYQSLGIVTAERAGLPERVLKRARYIADIVSNPCQAVGKRLREALSSSSQVLQVPEEDVDVEGYDKEFEAGYQKALEDVKNHLKQLSTFNF